jgi:hypothetical protein
MYPISPGPPTSVDAPQLSEIDDPPSADAIKFAGTVGGVASTWMLVIAVFVPFAFVAVRVYTVVEAGFIVVEPATSAVEKDPGVIVIDDALVTFHERVAGDPAAICEGEALNNEITGAPAAAIIGKLQLAGAALITG